MKFLIRFRIPTEYSNKLLQDPNFPKKLEAVLKQIKAEAAYFTPIEGERGGYVLVAPRYPTTKNVPLTLIIQFCFQNIQYA